MAAQRTVEANVSAARRADAASAAAANNEAAASAAKRAYVASAARRSYGGHANETGGGVGYGDGAPRGDNEATAFAAMLVRVTMSARCMGDEKRQRLRRQLRDGRPSLPRE